MTDSKSAARNGFASTSSTRARLPAGGSLRGRRSAGGSGSAGGNATRKVAQRSARYPPKLIFAVGVRWIATATSSQP
jgi:hypothetical protein